MEAFFISTSIVTLAEMGDKTQLLSLVLAARFKRPWPILWGILIATLANHALAGAVGASVTAWLGPQWLRWILAGSFIAMAAWMLVPDKLDDDDAPDAPRHGVLVTTIIAFFLAEMGDKTQIATIAMAAHFATPVLVVIGTTMGMLIADVPAVFAGEKLATRIPMKLVHGVAAGLFALLGLATLLGVGREFGF